jgi:hypothetical protein
MRITSRNYFLRSKESAPLRCEFHDLQRAAEALRIATALTISGTVQADEAAQPGEMAAATPDDGVVVNLCVHRATRHLRRWID